MGANIGTSVTNTAVALTQVQPFLKNVASIDYSHTTFSFRLETDASSEGHLPARLSMIHSTCLRQSHCSHWRLASVGGMNNCKIRFCLELAFQMGIQLALTIVSMLPIGYLEHLTQAMVDPISTNTTKFEKVEFLQVLTKPLVHKIVIIDSKIEACWRSENKNDSNCMKADPFLKQTSMICGVNPGTCKDYQHFFIRYTQCNFMILIQGNRHHLFRGTSLSDISAGLLLFFLCVLVICICLVIVVKLLSSMLKGMVLKSKHFNYT